MLILYDASAARREAVLLDIREAEEHIEAAVPPRVIPREVIRYLAPQGRVDFYLDIPGGLTAVHGRPD